MNRATASPEFGKLLQPPGGMMIWVFIFMELLAFGLAFIVFAVLRSKSLDVVSMFLFMLVLFGEVSCSL